MATIVVAEDHNLVRQGIKALLKEHTGFDMVGETGDGTEAVALTAKLKPDVLLLDLTLPRLHGLEVIRQVKQECKTKVVVLSMHSDPPFVMEAFRFGASGYVLKDSTSEELVEAIRTATNGESYLSKSLRRTALLSSFKAEENAGDEKKRLTAREQMVLKYAAEGMSNPEIAGKLFISTRTVETHRANILKKLGLRSQTDLVRYAIRKQIIPL